MVDFDVDRTRAFWWGLAAVFGVTVAYVVHTFIGTFVFAIFIYYATRPAYKRIGRRIRRRSIAAALSLAVFALPAVALLAYTIAIALQELNNLDGQQLGPVMGLIEPYANVSEIVENPATLVDQASVETAQSTLFAALEYIGFIGNGLLHLFVMFALAYYMLKDGSRLSRWFLKFGDDRGVLETYARAVDQDFASIFFGNILNAIVTGAIGAISFNLLNLVGPQSLQIPYPALLGVLTGVASLIPVVGMKIVYVPMLGHLGYAAYLQDGGFGFVALVAGVTIVIVDLLPDFVLRPYVSGRNLHIGLVMFAYILGPLLFGWHGIFLGPIILVLVFHFARIVLPELLAGTTIRPVAVDPTYLTQTETTAPPDGTEPGVTDGGPHDDAERSADDQQESDSTDADSDDTRADR
ncbi:AI-2E family transporter [Halorientalis regularis]|jgi:predicted PurR-regulated permease PerM|uniref:Predicted PurR-regulated permease PerM n=1 Tax=Halorientalis regularis TaxID=660518 RepID=A0A1G7NNM3_9EURY|nr:AI-2E family transporter [Halorientalis regularis]SDF75593.1 Predicted PurR-regulated permease PerM [Halorientalis regularis]